MEMRMPYADAGVIPGSKQKPSYLAMQKKIGRYYLYDFLDRLSLLNNKGSFLEIGPGPGYQAAMIARRLPEVNILALEQAADMLSTGRAYINAQRLSERITYVQGSVEDEKLVSGLGQFDVVYATFSLHCWRDPRKVIENLYQVLKCDGKILFYDFERDGQYSYLPVNSGFAESVRDSHTLEEIEAILSDLKIENYQVGTKFPYMWIVINKAG